MLPSINWESPLVWAVVILTAVHFAVHAATFAAIGFLLFKKVKSNVSKGAQALSKWMSSLGFSATVTQPLDDVASGSALAFGSDGLKEVQYLHDPANRAKEIKQVMSTGLADPVIGPPLREWLTDLLGGASDEVLTADSNKLVAAIHSGAPVLPNQAHFDQFMHVLDSLHAGNTTMADITGLVSTNPAFANISGFASKLLAFGHDMGSAAAKAAPLVAGASIPLAPVLAPAAAVAAVTAPVVVPVAAAVAAANTVTIPAGHQAIITPVPATVAAA